MTSRCPNCDGGDPRGPKCAQCAVDEVARNLDFAVDVTELRETMLARFREILLGMRLSTVRDTIQSLQQGGWLSPDDARHVLATLGAYKCACDCVNCVTGNHPDCYYGLAHEG